MRYDWMDEYLLSKRSVTRDLQPEWNWIRYKIGDRMFAAILLDDDDKPYYINLKLEPTEGEFLRGQYADIIPGYYSDKRCWNSVMPDGEVPDALLKTLLDKSYSLVLRGFPKKRQREILGLSACGTDCAACPLHGEVCRGCNAAMGRVFHAPEGKACPIYACCCGKRRHATCGDCAEVPCATCGELTGIPENAQRSFIPKGKKDLWLFGQTGFYVRFMVSLYMSQALSSMGRSPS